MGVRMLLAAGAAGLALAGAAGAEKITFERGALADPARAAAVRAEIARAAERECRKANDRIAALSPSLRRRAVEDCVAAAVEKALADAKPPRR